jgi:hypothetical protein
VIVKEKGVWTYPSGKVRRFGPALTKLRRDCWNRDHGWCRTCQVATRYEPLFDGDPQAFDMAHIQSLGAGGSDVLENVQTQCHRCHMREHKEGQTVSMAEPWNDDEEEDELDRCHHGIGFDEYCEECELEDELEEED